MIEERVVTVLDRRDISVDLEGHLICKGQITLPEHEAFRIPSHKAISYKDRQLFACYAERDARTGFFKVAPGTHVIVLPETLAFEIERALTWVNARGVTLKGEQGEIHMRKSPLEISQKLSNWTLKIGETADGGCRIALSSALYSEKQDVLRRAIVNYWPHIDGKPQRLKVRFTVDPATRLACFGTSVRGAEFRKTTTSLQHFSPYLLADTLFPLSNSLPAFAESKLVRANISRDSFAWDCTAHASVRASAFVRGVGKEFIEALLRRSRMFDVRLKGEDVVWFVGGRDAHADGWTEPTYQEVRIKGELNAFGLCLDIKLSSSPRDAELTERLAIPWSALILRRFNVWQHREALMRI